MHIHKNTSKQACGNRLLVFWSNTIDVTAIFTAWLRGFSLKNSSKQFIQKMKRKKKKHDPCETQFISVLYKPPLACAGNESDKFAVTFALPINQNKIPGTVSLHFLQKTGVPRKNITGNFLTHRKAPVMVDAVVWTQEADKREHYMVL